MSILFIYNLEKIEFEKNVLTVRTDSPAQIEIISKKGIIKTASGKELTFTLDEKEKAEHVFLRVKAYDKSGEILFSQPFILTACLARNANGSFN